MRKFLLSLCLVALASQAQAANILVTRFDFEFNGVDPWDVYDLMADNLEADGHTVDVVDVRPGGTLASTLASEVYDQVFLFDLTATSYLSGADVASLAAFWGDHSGLVVDTRSYGYHFQGDNPSEIALLQNVATNLAASGGGVWVGTDHDSAWTQNGNPFLLAIGVNPVIGSHSEAVNFADPSSVLLAGVTPVDLWAAGQSVGEAPLGIQPNGIEMFLHFGHIRGDGSILPYISASFPLEGVDPIVPEPTSLALFAIGLTGLVAGRRRKVRKSA